MHNHSYIMKYNMNQLNTNRLNRSDKECCLICSLIIFFHLSYLGTVLFIFENNDWDNSINNTINSSY